MELTDVRSRQAELVDEAILTEPIKIIGCGAIGSFTALTLAKMGFHNIELWDNDLVSEENISNQFFSYDNIGDNKALATYRMLHKFEDIEVTYHECLWTRSHILNGTVVMAVDSMTARGNIYDKVAGNRSVHNFIDARMGGQQAEIYAFRNVEDERAKYCNYLWPEEEASELRCTQKAVMYNVLWISSAVANTLRLMLEYKPYNNIVLMDFENQEQHKVAV
jgi:hypothetical protein